MARRGWRGNKPTPEQIREEVDYWVERGVGGFKAKLIDPESLEALIDQAHKHGLTVTGHLDSGYRNSVNPRDAISMGIDRIEHFFGRRRNAQLSLGLRNARRYRGWNS